jgi:hypothetical protein
MRWKTASSPRSAARSHSTRRASTLLLRGLDLLVTIANTPEAQAAPWQDANAPEAQGYLATWRRRWRRPPRARAGIADARPAAKPRKARAAKATPRPGAAARAIAAARRTPRRSEDAKPTIARQVERNILATPVGLPRKARAATARCAWPRRTSTACWA